MDCKGLKFPVEAFTTYFKDRFDFNLTPQSDDSLNSEIRFLIVGFHTERRVFNGSKVRNGTSVSITKRDHDENEHPMVYIHTVDVEHSGWIYERNVSEFQ